MEERYEFNEITLLSAFAMGVPGKRTFFLVVGDKGRWLRAWLEKDQLQTLGLAVDQFMSILSHEHPGISLEAEGYMPLSDDISSGLPSAEVEIDEMSLGYEDETAILSFVVHVLGPQQLDRALVQCRVTLSQLKQFGAQAKKICAAGRPLCPICGGPVDPTGHVCPKNN